MAALGPQELHQGACGTEGELLSCLTQLFSTTAPVTATHPHPPTHPSPSTHPIPEHTPIPSDPRTYYPCPVPNCAQFLLIRGVPYKRYAPTDNPLSIEDDIVKALELADAAPGPTGDVSKGRVA